MGSHSLPFVTGRVASVVRLQRVCKLCQTGNPGDEQYRVQLAVFKCPALQGVADKSNGLFGDHATTMVQFMWRTVIMALRARH